MKLALSSGWFAEGTALETAARRTRDLGLGHLGVTVPGPVPAGPRDAVRGVGVAVPYVGLEGSAVSDEDFDAERPAAVAAAARLRAPLLVVEGGGLGREALKALRQEERSLLAAVRRGEAPDAEGAMSRRLEHREAAAHRAARSLHGAMADGVSLALRNGGHAGDLLLGPEETTWLLDDLPSLGLFFDPARAHRAWRLGLGPEPAAWADRLAGRTVGVFVQGLGSDLAGRSHPEDVGPDWVTLGQSLPRRVPWVLDLAPALAAADVEDAIRYLNAMVGD